MRPEIPVSWRSPALLALHAASLWPVWRWYVSRMSDGSDEPWGLASLAAALVFAWIGRERSGMTEADRIPPFSKVGTKAGSPDSISTQSKMIEAPSDPLLGLAAVLTLIYALTLPISPALARAGIAVTALGATLAAVTGARRRFPAIAALLVLSLPLVSSAQFYLGYPLRVLTAAGSAMLLSAVGFTVERAGTAMLWQGQTVLVDAPCSGVKMLWVGLFLACFLAAQRRAVRLSRLAATLAFAVGAVLLGNSLRAAALFVAEIRSASFPALAHDAVGIAVFMLTCASIVAVALWRHHAR